MTILTHLDKLSNQAADRYTFYRESNHKLAAKFGEIAVRLWHKRMARYNEDKQEVMKSMEEKILNGKVIVTAKDPENVWDSGLAVWDCHSCHIGVRQEEKPNKCPNCKNKNLVKRGV